MAKCEFLFIGWKDATKISVTNIYSRCFLLEALDRGDKILSINGKKHPKELRSIEQARELLGRKAKATVFVMRPDPNEDEGYKWVMCNTTDRNEIPSSL